MGQAGQINSIALAIIILGLFALIFFLRRQARIFRQSQDFTLPDNLPSTGVDIPVIGSYSGIKGSIYLTIGENTFNPKLILYDNSMEYRMLVLKRVDYSQIESVQEISFLFSHYLKISFYDQFFTFSVRLANQEIMHKIADFFHSRGIPVKGVRRQG